MTAGSGRVALVTGASSGIGAAVARRLAGRGDTVVVHYNSDHSGAEATLAACAEAGGSGHTSVQADLGGGSEVDRIFDHVRSSHDGLDVLVSNAGGLIARSKVEDADEALVSSIIGLNLVSAILVAGAAVPLLRRRKGTMINVTSIASYTGGGGGSAIYGAAKGGIISLTRSLAKELAEDGIRVNAISPGVIATPFHDRYTKPEMMTAMVGTIPMGRAGTAEEVADLVEFLSGPASTYITGQTIQINGGQYFT